MNTESSEAGESKPEQQTKKGRPFPIWLAGLLLVSIVSIIALQYFGPELHDSLAQQDHGVINILCAAITLLAVFILTCWLFFFSRWSFLWARLIPIAIFLLPFLVFIPFKPQFDGNMGIVGLEPRFWSNEPEIEEKNDAADLTRISLDDFPQFFGPNRDGNLAPRSYEFSKPEMIWKKTVGDAWSGFAAVNGFCVTMEQSGNEELVTCYRIDNGDLVWSYRHEARYQDPTNMGRTGPRCTPTIHEGNVYASGGTGILVCLNGNTGELIWRVDVPKLLEIESTEHSTFSGFKYTTENNRLVWGRAASPLIYQDKVIVPGGGPGNEGPFVSLIAFHKDSGEELWRGGSEMISYGSPALLQLNGAPVIAIINESSVAGHDPETGKELWKHERPGTTNADANCSQPIQVASDMILACKGYGLGGELIKIDGNKPISVWKNTRAVKTKFTIPVVCGDHIYSLSDGILECVELETGKRVWKRNRFGQGQLLLAGKTLLVHSETGTLHFIEATPEGYKENRDLMIDTVGGVCWNTPCLFGDLLLVRSEREAACFKISQAESMPKNSGQANQQTDGQK